MKVIPEMSAGTFYFYSDQNYEKPFLTHKTLAEKEEIQVEDIGMMSINLSPKWS